MKTHFLFRKTIYGYCDQIIHANYDIRNRDVIGIL